MKFTATDLASTVKTDSISFCYIIPHKKSLKSSSPGNYLLWKFQETTTLLSICNQPSGKASGTFRENVDTSRGKLSSQRQKHLCSAASHPQSPAHSPGGRNLVSSGSPTHRCARTHPPRSDGAPHPLPAPPLTCALRRPSAPARPARSAVHRAPRAALPRWPDALPSFPAPPPNVHSPGAAPSRSAWALPAAAAGPDPRASGGQSLRTAPSWGEPGRDSAAARTVGPTRDVATEQPNPARPARGLGAGAAHRALRPRRST